MTRIILLKKNLIIILQLLPVRKPLKRSDFPPSQNPSGYYNKESVLILFISILIMFPCLLLIHLLLCAIKLNVFVIYSSFGLLIMGGKKEPASKNKETGQTVSNSVLQNAFFCIRTFLKFKKIKIWCKKPQTFSITMIKINK